MAPRITVTFKPGSHIKADPQAAYEAVEKIRLKNNGDLKPEDVVDAARRPRHVLHNDFEWDDTIAAEKHREERARLIIRSFVVVECERQVPEYRAYEIRVRPADDASQTKSRKVYGRTEDIMADPDDRRELLESALRDLRNFRRRYAQLQELAALMPIIDDLLG